MHLRRLYILLPLRSCCLDSGWVIHLAMLLRYSYPHWSFICFFSNCIEWEINMSNYYYGNVCFSFQCCEFCFMHFVYLGLKCIFIILVTCFVLKFILSISLWLQGFQVTLVVKCLPANAGDASLDPGSGSSPGMGSGNPLQYCCLQILIDRGAWQATVRGAQSVRDD